MPYKDEDLYKKAFQMIDDALGHAFSWPQDLSVMMDFEQAERKAWLYVHPTHKLEGCMFHFDGGLWKYVHKNGMSIMYNSDTDQGKIFKGIVWMTFSLPLVPLERLDEAIDLIRSELLDQVSPSFQSWCEDYLTYILSTWIHGHFPPTSWNFYDRLEDGHLTNNACEGLNNRLRSKMKTDHPGIYKFFGVISQETSYSFSKIEQTECGNLVRFQTRKTLALQKTRVNLKILLQNNQITLRKYMRAQGALNGKVKQPQRSRNPASSNAPADVNSVVTVALDSFAVVGRGAARGNRRFRGGALRTRGGRGRGIAPAQRQCPDCGGLYSRLYLRTHQRMYCQGTQHNVESLANQNEDEAFEDTEPIEEESPEDIEQNNNSDITDGDDEENSDLESIFHELSEVEKTIGRSRRSVLLNE